jgi:hypothetical protein
VSDNFFRREKAKSDEAARVKTQYEFAARGLLEDLFPHQKQCVLDPYTRKSLLTPRRAGKTHTAITYALYTACLNPHSRVPIITLTLKSAKKLYWVPLQNLSDKHGLGIKFNYSENTAYLQNGAAIFLAGAETRADIEKLRGGAYKLVLIDECKSFNTDVFNELIYEILNPATNDTSGTILIIGTPGSLLDGPFYEATCPALTDEDENLITRDFYTPEQIWEQNDDILPRWNRHHWTVAENIYAPHTWQNALDDKKRNRWPDDHPIWVRESLGQWVSAAETQVYALHSIVGNSGGPANAICCWNREYGDAYDRHGLPLEHHWNYVMGLDLGYEDDFALIVVAYSPTTDTMYQVHEFKAPHLTIPAAAEVIQRVIERFNHRIESFVADTGGLGKALVESMNEMYGFWIEAAEKTQKFDFIELLNSDLYAGKLRIEAGSDLYAEMMALQFDLGGRSKQQAVRLRKLRENSRQSNHLCDAMLYTWRYCQHHFSRELVPEVDVESIEHQENLDYDMACAAAERRDRPVVETLPEWTDDLALNERSDDWIEMISGFKPWKD